MADTKVSALTALAGSAVDAALDLLSIVDTSASESKKITIAELSNALALIAAGSDASYVGPVARWVKVGSALSYTAFQTAATTKSNTLFSLVAGGIVHAVKVKHSTAFAGTSITAVTMKVGIAGTLDKYASAFNVLGAVTDTNFELSNALGTEDHNNATNITITADSTGANLSALTAGVVDVWALISVAK